jgi:prepilin-type processing-associated H-X9-DG protein
MRTWVASLTVLVIVFATTSSPAQPLADRLPDGALIYVGWVGSDNMGPGYAGSHLEAVLKESKFSDFVNVSIPKVLAKIGATDREAAEITGLISAIAGPMWRHPSAFYFGGIDPPAGPNQPPSPRIALMCNAGAEARTLADQLRKVTANVPAPFPINVEEQGGVVLWSIGAKGWGAGQKPANPLSTGRNFTSALAQVQKTPVVAVYVDVQGIVSMVDAMAGNGPEAQSWAKARDALGLARIGRAIWTSGFDGKDWMSQAYVEAPAPRTGAVPAMFDAKPLSDEILKSIPQTATVAMAGRFDLGGLVRGIRSAVAQIEPQAGQQIDGFFAQVKDAIGLDLQTDLFDVLGDEWALYVDPMTAGNGMLGFAVVNRAKNPPKLDQSLSKLEEVANSLIRANMGQGDGPQMTIEFKRTPVNGATLHDFAIPFVSPSWAVKDGNLYLGLYPQVVEAALAQPGNKSILDNEDYLALRKRLGNVPASGFTFANLPKTAPEGYQEVLMISRLYLGFADMFGADTPALLLPPLRKIMPHLSPAGSVSWSDNAGWHAKAVSPFPGSGLLTPGGGGQMMIGQQALLVSIMLPSLNRARETANRVKCGSNMRQIGMAILLYSNENRGKYPPDLAALIKTQDITAECFICPSGNTAFPPNLREMKPDDVGKWVNENSNYVYLGGGMNNTAGAEVIVLYEKPEDHRQGMNMLFGDGHVEFFMMPEAQRMIEAQKNKKKGGRL